ncbi:crotonase/enoyl-CoA hydratase family protein [Ramlibacter albus]|uniref:Crotonase/enoyl-CoA hydratase family protein n=1 Tax=Ramlibacter albus TaxID=2079448 RepID=A0A923M577_9BURK|nr:crotonase/enoyl-CoA hydratase family protein [Ramlibacter albus]MBC5762956.1 crotonase/enoyl-CoA hydratase family protein [Ramlibacter albus]
MTTPTTPPAFDTLLLAVDQRRIATLTLNRPDTHNALNAALIADLKQAADWLGCSPGLRAVVLTGAGATFCAGGDLGWMQQNMSKTRSERVDESFELALMLRTLNELPVPLIGRINGAAYGGGVGMISVCDVSVAVDTGVFCLTEVRLGLLPANISPYVVARMGEANARRTFLTARRMDAAEARRLGLVSEIVPADQLDAAVERELADLMQCAPGAVAATKRLVSYVNSHDLPTSMIYAADKLADAWETEEGRAGIEAFFARRPPPWRQG